MGQVTVDFNGVRLSRLNWGWQVVHDNLVLEAIYDKDGLDKALAAHEKYSRLYARLYDYPRPPTQVQLTALHRIVNPGGPSMFYRRNIHGNVIKALHRRGVIRKEGAVWVPDL